MANNSLAAAELLFVLGLLGWFFYAQQITKKHTAQLKKEHEAAPPASSEPSSKTSSEAQDRN
jgi:hypothetical protein